MKYKCSNCGQEHDEWVSLDFPSPYFYEALKNDPRTEFSELTSDTCVLTINGETHRFIRGVLIQKVNDSCQDLQYGVWVSLSEKSFQSYLDNFDNSDREGGYFGWLVDFVPETPIKTNVLVQKNLMRPIIEVQEDNDFSLPFIQEYFDGISEEEALRRIEEVYKNND